MAQDPAFLFYPGDYLRDTQCLSEKVQVSYDRIMCEHMRNICISQAQLKFFTKKLTEEEIEELKMVLTETSDGFQIKWVAESIDKRRNYSDSRRKNRLPKTKKDMIDTSNTYDTHMENENENENKDTIDIEKGSVREKTKIPTFESIQLYFESLRMPEIEAEKFMNFYQSNDWMVGKNKMKDWKAAARGWALRNQTKKPTQSKSPESEMKDRANSAMNKFLQSENLKNGTGTETGNGITNLRTLEIGTV